MAAEFSKYTKAQKRASRRVKRTKKSASGADDWVGAATAEASASEAAPVQCDPVADGKVA